MKNPDRTPVTQLEQLPNIGKAMAADLRFLGINMPCQLVGR
ncbi:MAG: mitomycin resistance protein, partial [Desulfobulbus sp.]